MATVPYAQPYGGAQPVAAGELWWNMNGRAVVLGTCAAVAFFLPSYRSLAIKAGAAFFAYLLLKSAREKGWF